jgi:hypothetical protein
VRRLPWLSLLLVLPWVAWADDPGMAQEPVPPEVTAAVARAEATFEPEPALDLSVEPTLPALPALEDTRVIPALARVKRPEPHAQAPLSFGLAVRTRHEVGDEARQDHDQPPGLGEQVEGIVRRSTIGVTGTYRF